MNDFTDRVIHEVKCRATRAIVLASDDQDMWDALAKAVHLHRPSSAEQLGLPLDSLRCQECSSGEYGQVSPCQTLRLISEGLGVKVAA
jgi:hypothetical protein